LIPLKNRNFENFTLIWALLIFSITITACNGGDVGLGVNLIPGASVIYSRNYEEEGNIRSYTFTDEKIRVDHPTANFVGSFNDPIFGRTDGSFAAQLRISSNPVFDPAATLDSLVLRLTYKEIYGDTSTVQTLNVYEMLGDLDFDAKYMSTFNLKALTSPNPIGTASFIPKFKTDSANTDTVAQYVRIRLDPLFGNRLLKFDSLKMASNEEFLKNFKGIYIEPSPVNRKGTLIGLSPTSTAMGIYYHTAAKDSLFFIYNVSANSANIAAFSHNYLKSEFISHLNQEVIQDTLIYVQPTGGTKAKINIPSLDKWKDSTSYIIDKATIVFYVDTLASDMDRFHIPPRVYLKYLDSTGTEVFPKDSELSSYYYGGYYDSTTGSYTFNITRHLQQIIKKEIETTSFYLVHADRSGTASRVILKSGNSSQPIKLQVKYTRYE
jgi:hypothetical protein